MCGISEPKQKKKKKRSNHIYYMSNCIHMRTAEVG